MKLHPIAYRDKLEAFLKEDIGHGDITTLSLGLSGKSQAVIRAKESLVVAGLVFAEEIFKILDRDASVKLLVEDGAFVEEGKELAVVEAQTEALLMGERTALNLLQRLSGIATLTKEMVNLISRTKATLVDTRKTTPGMRIFEKYAVRIGGAKNHRIGLYDAVLIKDNHIKAVGSIRKAVELVRRNTPFTAKVEIEVSTIDELKEAISSKADIVLLDNMDVETIKEAVSIASGKVLLEASGGVTPENIKEIAETGVDYISCGFLIHHATWKDINMKIR